MTASSHICFQAPKNHEIRIWRYLDFTKYVSLLESKALYFCRCDLFEDSFEGSVTRPTLALRPLPFIEAKVEGQELNDLLSIISRDHATMPNWTYVNSWHMNEYESAAMWKLYSRGDASVAIQSKYNLLHNSLPAEAYVGIVHYLDYERDYMPTGNGFWPIVCKRKSFKFEQELRAVLCDLSSQIRSIGSGEKNLKLGEELVVDIDHLIEKIYVSPYSPDWFAELVKKVTSKYGHSFPIVHSSLTQDPVY